MLSTSDPPPPVASIVDTKYLLNELVHGIGTPVKQTSSLDPAALKYSIFFLLILSQFSSITSLQLSSCCSNLDSSHITRSSAKSSKVYAVYIA